MLPAMKTGRISALAANHGLILVLAAVGAGRQAPALAGDSSTNSLPARMGAWPRVALAAPGTVELDGAVGVALKRGVERLGQPPFTADWILADVAFKVERMFTNYSGDVSGRFLELASLTSPRGQMSPPALGPVLAEIVRWQKPDGHFGREMDFTQPVQKSSPPIPMLWGNARLLVGLVTAAQVFNNSNLLAAARRLGDFYVASASQFCSPAREQEFLATGTYGDGFACCYFPAIESLALLYRATHDERYLQQARRMADLFGKFDALPTDHSHGNLCAWRGILELYDLTGERSYLERAQAKWDAAVNGGYVWPIGGVGEHWYRFFACDEGCSESDWLRFNLELWRFTGESRYLDMAERLLLNQYAFNQSVNGGYGSCHLDGDNAGPVGKHPQVEEWYWCCSFHGPLGLHYLKAYLAAGSDRGVLVNFPMDFSSTVNAAGTQWQLAVKTVARNPAQGTQLAIKLTADDQAARTMLFLRVPGWAAATEITETDGTPLKAVREGGYLRVENKIKSGDRLIVRYRSRLLAEARRFKPIELEPGRRTVLTDVCLVAGPDVLFAGADETNRLILLATVDNAGRLSLPAAAGGGFFTVGLPSADLGTDELLAALNSSHPVALRPWSELPKRKRAAFAHNLVIVPGNLVSPRAVAGFLQRARDFAENSTRPVFGTGLEKRPAAWPAISAWKFSPQGLRVEGGNVGLIESEGYTDYRFEFDLVLPKEGQGIAGWVVRATDAGNCLMFQLQSADSSLNQPQFKTRPNTLRPHVCHNGQWTIADPVPLPKEIRRGESHHIVLECQGDRVSVFLDGTKVHSQTDAGFHQGAIGFYASGAPEQGLFSNIGLRPL